MPQDKPKLNNPQRTLMYALMAEARKISNLELDQCCGLRIVGEDRRVLNAEKLVTSEKSGRTFDHVLTERGWTWCRAEFSSTPGERPAPLDRVVYRMTAALDRYLSAHRLAIDALFTAEATEATEVAEVTEVIEVPEAAENLQPVEEPATADRVRQAYTELAAEPGAWVRLTDLRRQLAGVPRAELDRVLKDLDGNGVTLIPEENQKTLRAEDREAAIRIGSEDNHLLSMAE
ncbi:hypothetical protein [Amycolatopsis sp. PS_44_ISF1]|uniref:hypothetical protein n=1 Tax=Amycolatopsis sp. PS_44_ISF1 TaxID=2974917 RepID=UPI0028DDEED2|nr:hypothetical protein [Amycolatopsis sp. PS_44_ISF1]MDT8915066.1 hypothetical protein [Amycolatopsis sp. PS_44_ISF1]